MKCILHFLFCFLVIAVSGCKTELRSMEGGLSQQQSVKIVNYDGYAGQGKIVEQVFTKIPEKVLVVSESTVDNLIFLGLEKHISAIAGCLTDPRYPQTKVLRKFNILTEGNRYPSKEVVLGFHPDLIVSWGSLFGESALGSVEYWHKKGIHTYILSNTVPGAKEKNGPEKTVRKRNISNIITDLRNLARIFRVEKENEEKIKALEKRIDCLKSDAQKVTFHQRPTVITIQYVYGNEYFCRPSTDLTTDIITLAGGRSLDDEVFGKRSIENLIKNNPDIILIVDMPQRPAAKKADTLRKNKLLANVGAIKSNRFFFLPYKAFYGGSPCTIDETERLKKFIQKM